MIPVIGLTLGGALVALGQADNFQIRVPAPGGSAAANLVYFQADHVAPALPAMPATPGTRVMSNTFEFVRGEDTGNARDRAGAEAAPEWYGDEVVRAHARGQRATGLLVEGTDGAEYHLFAHVFSGRVFVVAEGDVQAARQSSQTGQPQAAADLQGVKPWFWPRFAVDGFGKHNRPGPD